MKRLTFSKILLNNLKAAYLKSNITANGSVDNAIGYALKDEPIAGTLNVKADKLNLNSLWERNLQQQILQKRHFRTICCTKNIAFTLNAAVDKLTYDSGL